MSINKTIQQAMKYKLKKGVYSDPYIYSTAVRIVRPFDKQVQYKGI